MLEASVQASQCSPQTMASSVDVAARDAARALIFEWRRLQTDSILPHDVRSARRAEICKQIRKKIRDVSRAKKTAFRGLKQIGAIKAPIRKQAPTSIMVDSDGNNVSGEDGVAEVFRRFYEDL